MTDEGNTQEDLALAAELEALLTDASLWAEPPVDLEDRVVAAVAAAAAEDRPALPGGATTSASSAVRRPSRARRWLTTAGAAAAGAAAAVALTLVVTREDDGAAGTAVAMTGTELAPGVVGTADVTVVRSGVRIDLSLPGLPRRDGGEFYQVWLKRCDGTELVPAGSFHELDDAIAWAGVDPVEFPLVTVTREVVAPPKDAAQGSSGEVVAAGSISPCPP